MEKQISQSELMPHDLFSELIRYGKLMAEGRFPIEPPFEKLIHDALIDGLPADFVEIVKPLLVELEYIQETASTGDIVQLFQELDSGNDVDEITKLLDALIESAKLLDLKSDVAKQFRDNFLQKIQRDSSEVLRTLDYAGWYPMQSYGNQKFHGVLVSLAHLAYENSISEVTMR